MSSTSELPVCDGSMVCDCKLCAAERDARCKVGVRASVQPWSPATARGAFQWKE